MKQAEIDNIAGRCKIVLGKKERGRRAKRPRGRPLGGDGS